MKTLADCVVRIVDDEEGVRDALSVFFLMADLQTRCYDNAEAFLTQDDFSIPGCAILDVRMPGKSGIELFSDMKRQGIELPVIFLSAHGDISMAVEAVQQGAKTFLVKPPQPEKLLSTVKEACLENLTYHREATWKKAQTALWTSLSLLEQKVAIMIGKGLSNGAAAQTLNLSERAVRAHRESIYRKLDIENAVELADFLHDIPDGLKLQVFQDKKS